MVTRMSHFMYIKEAINDIKIDIYEAECDSKITQNERDYLLEMCDDLMMEMTRREFKSKNVKPMTKEITVLTAQKEKMEEELVKIDEELRDKLNNFENKCSLPQTKKIYSLLEMRAKDLYTHYSKSINNVAIWGAHNDSNTESFYKKILDSILREIDKYTESYNNQIKNLYSEKEYSSDKIKDLKHDISVLRELKAAYLKYVDKYKKFDDAMKRRTDLYRKVKATKESLKKPKNDDYNDKNTAISRLYSKKAKDGIDLLDTNWGYEEKYDKLKTRQKNIERGEFMDRKHVTDFTSKRRKTDGSYKITDKKLQKLKQELEKLKDDQNKYEKRYADSSEQGARDEYIRLLNKIEDAIKSKENEIDNLSKRYNEQKKSN